MSGDDTSNSASDDLEEVFAVLKASLSNLPEPPGRGGLEDVPDSVLSGARWVYDWVNMDAELADLTHDSSQDSSLASVRSNTSLRHITFESGDYEIQVEIVPAERGVSMTGTVSPTTIGTASAVVGGISHQGVIDEFGTFVIDNVDHGVVMAFITAEDVTIRLGSFEV